MTVRQRGKSKGRSHQHGGRNRPKDTTKSTTAASRDNSKNSHNRKESCNDISRTKVCSSSTAGNNNNNNNSCANEGDVKKSSNINANGDKDQPHTHILDENKGVVRKPSLTHYHGINPRIFETMKKKAHVENTSGSVLDNLPLSIGKKNKPKSKSSDSNEMGIISNREQSFASTALATAAVPIKSVEEIWQPSTTLTSAMAYVNNLDDGSVLQKDMCSLVMLRFLPAIGRNSRYQGSAFSRTNFTEDFAMMNLTETLEHCENPSVISVCLNSLCALSTYPPNVLPMCEAKLHKKVVAVSKLHSSNIVLVQMAVGTLSNLAFHKLSSPFMIEEQVDKYCISLILDESDSDTADENNHSDNNSSGSSNDGVSGNKYIVSECAISCLANIANTRDKGVAATLVKNGILSVCVKLLRKRLRSQWK
eukprot:m.106802 g.106802  ORF g.106802 m.106802 type:complete len:421 (-) comp12682_c0_seq1:1315-2577(-)